MLWFFLSYICLGAIALINKKKPFQIYNNIFTFPLLAIWLRASFVIFFSKIKQKFIENTEKTLKPVDGIDHKVLRSVSCISHGFCSVEILFPKKFSRIFISYLSKIVEDFRWKFQVGLNLQIKLHFQVFLLLETSFSWPITFIK